MRPAVMVSALLALCLVVRWSGATRAEIQTVVLSTHVAAGLPNGRPWKLAGRFPVRYPDGVAVRHRVPPAWFRPSSGETS